MGDGGQCDGGGDQATAGGHGAFLPGVSFTVDHPAGAVSARGGAAGGFGLLSEDFVSA
jgi:hypothetical protein